MKIKKILFSFLLIMPFLTNAQLAVNHVKPIDSLSTGNSTQWLENKFDYALKSIKIVGLGEVCHGGHEPFEIKAAMMKYLVTKQGYRQLLFEMADVALRAINDYLNNDSLPKSTQTIDSLFVKNDKISGSSRLFDADEIKSLFLWIKEYNLNYRKDKVTLRGIDISGMSYSYFRIKYFDNAYRQQLLQKWGSSMLTALQVEQIVNEWRAASLDSLKKVYTQTQMQTLQIDLRDFHNLVLYQSGGGEKSSDLMTLRDSIMALNVEELTNGKSIIWAHNTHVSNSGFHEGYFNAKTLGNFLKEKYENSYYIILTDFSDVAEVTVRQHDKSISSEHFNSNKKSLANILYKKFNIQQGLVFAKDIGGLNTVFGYNSIGAGGATNFIPCTSNDFDALIFIKGISPSHCEFLSK
ncbi:erythromycin esterase family protein [Mucilaginibacter sp. UYCu711]|uniref:erythromycin esterase family protein n=1 Tax=Mucilaginibacter sp. UYCu711 TaxID=3156339 RepID=UPI003D21B0A7